MLRDDFAALILTHGRPDNVLTLRTLAGAGYSGRWYLVLDDEDATRPQYVERFGADRVITFSKAAVAAGMDLADAGGTMSAVVFARNACDRIAADLGLTRYIQLDDDYLTCMYRYTDAITLRHTDVRRLDDVLAAMLDFHDASGALTVCFAQGGDYLGGIHDKFQQAVLRKAMNTFICRTGAPIGFLGRINEDVNAYVTHGGRGARMFTITDVCMFQGMTQQNAGGMTSAYTGGTYAKSFYPVMMRPDAVTIRMMGPHHPRPHHRVHWNRAVPKIISSRWQRFDKGR